MKLPFTPLAVPAREGLFYPAVKGPGPRFETWFAEDVVVPREDAIRRAASMIAQWQDHIDLFNLEQMK